jgi:hypothetical protein
VGIYDSSAKQVQRIDDVGSLTDPSLTWKATADDDYVVRVSDLHQHGDPSFFYRLWIEPEAPELVMLTANDLVVGKVGEPLELPITIERRGGFADTVKLKVTGLPDSVACDPVTSEPTGDSAKSVKLKFNATGPWSGPIRVESEPPVHRVVTEKTELDQIWLTVTAK